MATKKYRVHFRSAFVNGPEETYVVSVTDREEDRATWKRAVAHEKAIALFERDFGGNGNKYIMRNKTEEFR